MQFLIARNFCKAQISSNSTAILIKFLYPLKKIFFQTKAQTGIKIFSTETWTERKNLENETGDGVKFVGFSNDSKFLASATPGKNRSMVYREWMTDKRFEGPPCQYGTYCYGIISANNEIVGFSEIGDAMLNFQAKPLKMLKSTSANQRVLCSMFLGKSSKFVIPDGLSQVLFLNIFNCNELIKPSEMLLSKKYSFIQRYF